MSETNKKIQELLAKAAFREQELKGRKEAQALADKEQSAATSVEKIYQDRKEQMVRHEENQHADQVRDTVAQEMLRYQKELEALPGMRAESESKVSSPDTAAEVRELHEQILEELDAEDQRLREALHQAETKAIGVDESVRANNEFIQRSNQEASEVLGYDAKTREIRDYIVQQREFKAQPERFERSLDLMADAMIDTNIAEIKHRLSIVRRGAEKLSSLKGKAGYVTWVDDYGDEQKRWSAEYSYRTRHDPKVVELLRANFHRFTPEHDTALRNEIELEDQRFEQALFVNPYLVEALAVRIKVKAKERVAGDREFSWLHDSQKSEVEDVLVEASQSYGTRKKIPGLSRERGDTYQRANEPVPIQEPESIKSLTAEQRLKLEEIIDNPTRSFSEAAQELGLQYNENVLERIQDDALKENAEYDRQKRIKEIEEGITRYNEIIVDAEQSAQIYELANEYEALDERLRQYKDLEIDKNAKQGELESLREQLTKVESDRGFLGGVKDKKRQQELTQSIAARNREIQNLENQMAEVGKGLDTYNDLRERLINELVQHRPYDSGHDRRTKPPIQNTDTYLRKYMDYRKGALEYDNQEATRAGEKVLELQSELEQLTVRK